MVFITRASRARFALFSLTLFFGCGVEEGEPTLAVDESPVIVDDEDWDDLSRHTPTADPTFNNGNTQVATQGRAVARLQIPGLFTRTGRDAVCSAFLVAKDLLVTAAHCVTTDRGVLHQGNKTATFGLFSSNDPGAESFTCGSVVDIDQAHDVAVLRCQPNSAGQLPGERWPILELDTRAPRDGERLYLISFNCRTNERDSDGNCLAPRLMMSPGGFASSASRLDKCVVEDESDSWSFDFFTVSGFETSCDAMPGSSGAPIFQRDTGRVVGVLSGEYEDLFTEHNDAGALTTYVAAHDANGNRILDVAEEGPHLLWTRPTDGTASIWRLTSNDAFVSANQLPARGAGLSARAYSRRSAITPSKLLWSDTNGNARIQRLTVADRPTSLPDVVHGPFGPTWVAMDYEQLSATRAKLLWSNLNDGSATLWTLDQNDAYLSHVAFPARGAAWTVRAYTALSNGQGKLVWSHTNGTAEVWTLSATDTFVSSTSIVGGATWAAVGFERRRDGASRLLWSRATDKLAAIWRVSSTEQYLSHTNQGPFTEWWVEDYSGE